MSPDRWRGPVPATDAQITRILLLADSADSARGVLAGRLATSPAVRSYGNVAAAEDGRLDRRVVALVKRLNLNPQWSPMDSDLDSRLQRMTIVLQAKTGLGFDSLYLEQESRSHQRMLADLDGTLMPAARDPLLERILDRARAVRRAQLAGARGVLRMLRSP